MPTGSGLAANPVTPKTDLTITGELDFFGSGAVGNFNQNLAVGLTARALEALAADEELFLHSRATEHSLPKIAAQIDPAIMAERMPGKPNLNSTASWHINSPDGITA